MPRFKNTRYPYSKCMDIKKEITSINKNPLQYGNDTPVKTLELVLRKLSHHYYNTKKALVSDEIFDVLKEALENRDPKNKFLKEVGAPLSKDKVKLPYWLGSQDKIKASTSELEKWLNDFAGPYDADDKLDGNSALLHKDDDGKVRMYSRGNGVYGLDISYLIPFVIDDEILNSQHFKAGYAVRGELIISKKNFKKLAKTYANARNSVAGLVTAKNYSTKVASLTDFVAYTMIEPKQTHSKQRKLMKKIGFKVVYSVSSDELSNEYLSKLLMKRRKEGEYEIDGIVVTDDSQVHRHNVGNPRHSFAFKTVLTDQMAEVMVVDVHWNISMDARLVPRVEVRPVDLVGVTITYATGHNAKFIVDNKIGPGAVIRLIRSGDVIPYIVDVIKPAASGKPAMPKEEHEWNLTKVDLYLKNPDDHEDVIVGKLQHFFKTMGVKHLSVGLITKLVANGYHDVFSIINADKSKMADIDGMGESSVKRIFIEITKSFERVKLHQLMAASRCFGRGLGLKKLRLVTNHYPDIMKMKLTKKELLSKILDIDGYDVLTATYFADNFTPFKKFYTKLSKSVDLSSIVKAQKEVKSTNGKLKGEKIVFTGFRDKGLEERIERNGGSVSSTVSSRTTLLIHTDTNSSKYKKAVKLGVKTIEYQKFVDKLAKK